MTSKAAKALLARMQASTSRAVMCSRCAALSLASASRVFSAAAWARALSLANPSTPSPLPGMPPPAADDTPPAADGDPTDEAEPTEEEEDI